MLLASIAANGLMKNLKVRMTTNTPALIGMGVTGLAASAGVSEEQKAAELPLLTDSILRIVEQAAKLDACFALEPVFVHALDTVEKRRGKEFISVEEFSMCCNKLSKTHIEQLRALGAFAGMADTSQITFF